MEGLIDKKATVEQIDSWFSTPQEDRIRRLASTIRVWREEDLSRLGLAKRLLQEEVMELLETNMEGRGPPVIRLLVTYNQTFTLFSLLDRVTSQNLLSLFMLKDLAGTNLLGRALEHNRLAVPYYLVKRLGVNKLCDLLFDRDEKSSRSALHVAVAWNHSISEVLSLLMDETRAHRLLSIKDFEGRSVLSCSIYVGKMESFQSIIMYYTGKQVELLRLADITDNEGNTSFHHAAGQRTSKYLTDLITATCSKKTRGELANVLSKRNDSGSQKKLGCEVAESDSNHEFIYDWAFDSLTNNRYLLCDFPSVLIMYNTAQRDQAGEKAASLEKCFTGLGFKVDAKSSFTKKELFESIKEQQTKQASRNGQIVALMSHGCEGCVYDRDGKKILLQQVEQQMCADSHRDTPKLLILQCCQNPLDFPHSGNTPSFTSSADPKPRPKSNLSIDSDSLRVSYTPRNPDFCVLMSTGPGSYSERNTFIPFLAKAIQDANFDTDIAASMKIVKGQFPVNYQEQVPYCHDGLKFFFCLKSILPIHLSSARKTESEAAEGRQQDPT